MADFVAAHDLFPTSSTPLGMISVGDVVVAGVANLPVLAVDRSYPGSTKLLLGTCAVVGTDTDEILTRG